MKTIFLIFLVSSSTVVSQLLLKKGALDLKINRLDFSLLLSAVSSPYIVSSICLQFISFVLWFVVLSKANLGYAIGFSGAFLYLMLPLLSWFIYDEKLAAIQWLGLFFITAGIVCMANKG